LVQEIKGEENARGEAIGGGVRRIRMLRAEGGGLSRVREEKGRGVCPGYGGGGRLSPTTGRGRERAQRTVKKYS